MRRDKARIFDEYLAAAARVGDQNAFGLLAERWQPKLLRHAYRLSGDGEAARDIVQDAWADIVKGLPSLKDAAVFPAWAYRIVTRRAVDSIRKAQRRRRTSDAFAAEPAVEELSATKIENSINAAPLNAAIAALPPDQRSAIALFYQEEFSIAEIAAALDVPAGTVKTRLMHARRKLRATWKEKTNWKEKTKMNDLDKKIEEALDAEDRALMDNFGEQGIFAQTFGVFQGKMRWIAMMMVPVTLIFTLGAFYSGWMFFQAGDSVLALRWGILAWFMMSVVGFLKVWFWMRMESNRVIREIKRVELQLVRLQSKQIV